MDNTGKNTRVEIVAGNIFSLKIYCYERVVFECHYTIFPGTTYMYLFRLYYILLFAY